LLKDINIIIILGVILSSSILLSDTFAEKVNAVDSPNKVVKENDKDITNNTNENEVTVKLLASKPIKPEEAKEAEENALKYDDIKADDIKTAKVKDIVLGPKTRKKLGKEE
ncbi:hypothetical protein V6O07_20555, partial [Arthrospira platensis SPKY2]